jgi:hypothetical protein
MGNRRMMYGSERSVSQRASISDCQVGCFIKMILDASLRMTCLASRTVQDSAAPRKVRMMKPMYVPFVTAATFPSRLEKLRKS